MQLLQRNEDSIWFTQKTKPDQGPLSFLALANEIRTALGENAPLLDHYLTQLFEAAAQIAADTATSTDVIDNLFNMCGDKTEDLSLIFNPFFGTAQRFIDDYPLPFKDKKTRQAVYTTLLLDRFLKHTSEQHESQLTTALSKALGSDKLEHSRNRLRSVLKGSIRAKLKHMDEQFRSCFLIISANQLSSSAAGSLVSLLTLHDPGSGKQIFQLLFELDELEQN